MKKNIVMSLREVCDEAISWAHWIASPRHAAGLAMTLLCFTLSCAHPAFEAVEKTTATVSRTFETNANEAYYAIRWALKTSGYSITSEDLENGVVTSGWLSSKADSHYVAPFGRKDFGVNGAYYRLEIKLVPDGSSTTKIEITSRVKSMLAQLKSSEIEERKILNMVADYLRKPDIRVTNIGVEE